MQLLPECEESLWNQPHKVQHCLIDEIHGDGKLLIGVGSMDDRPAFYVMWVDSSIEDMKKGDFMEILDEVFLSTIEEECGQYDEDDEDYNQWPAAQFSGYHSWHIAKEWEFYELCRKMKSKVDERN